jgi:transmembrane sensor
MSANDESGGQPASSAVAIGDVAAEWAADRRNVEDWTPEREAAFETWLAQSFAHRVAYIRIEAVWRRTSRLAALRHPMRGNRNDLSARRPFLMRIAVVLGLIGITAIVVGENIPAHTNEQTFATAIGGHEQVILGDGTRIELNTDTLLRVSVDENLRSVTLDKGEAYFQVKHDAAHPFFVVAGNHRVTDLGTQFSVRHDLDRLKVLLVEGRARFETTDADIRAASLELSPGDEVIVTPTGGVSLFKRTVDVLKTNLGWRRGVIVFNNTSLRDAVSEFNRYGRTKLVFADPKLAGLTIAGTFQTNNIDAFADVLQAALGLHAENHNGTIVISAAK